MGWVDSDGSVVFWPGGERKKGHGPGGYVWGCWYTAAWWERTGTGAGDGAGRVEV